MAAEVSFKGGALEFGQATALFGGLPLGGGYQYDAAGDGQRFLAVLSPGESQHEPITVVMNWTAELKK